MKRVANKHSVAVTPRYFSPDLRYTIPEAAGLLRQSCSLTWRDIKDGSLRVIREGGRTFVPGSEIVRRSKLEQ